MNPKLVLFFILSLLASYDHLDASQASMFSSSAIAESSPRSCTSALGQFFASTFLMPPQEYAQLRAAEEQERKTQQAATNTAERRNTIIAALLALTQLPKELAAMVADYDTPLLFQHQDAITSLLFIPPHTLISGSKDTTIKLWDTKTGNCLRTCKHSSQIIKLALIGNGTIASIDSANTISIWNLQAGKPTRVYCQTNTDCFVDLLALSKTRIAAASKTGKLILWDTTKLSPKVLAVAKKIWSLALLANKKHLAVGNTKHEEQFIDIWDAKTTTPAYLQSLAIAHAQPWIRCCTALSDGTLISGLHDMAFESSQSAKMVLCRWNPQDAHEPHMINVPGFSVWSGAWTPRLTCSVELPNKKLATGWSNGYLMIFDLSTGKCVKAVTHIEGAEHAIHALVLLPPALLICASQDGTIKFWDLSEKQ